MDEKVSKRKKIIETSDKLAALSFQASECKETLILHSPFASRNKPTVTDGFRQEMSLQTHQCGREVTQGNHAKQVKYNICMTSMLCIREVVAEREFDALPLETGLHDPV